MATEDSESSRLVWLTLVAILRSIMSAQPTGNTSWDVKQPFEAFEQMVHDMRSIGGISGPRAKFEVGDARTCIQIPENSVTLETSPPYANNYDYADATRLELTFLGEITSWLQSHVRRHLIRSCTQHDKSVSLADVLASPELDPIENIQTVCEQLGGNEEARRHITTWLLATFSILNFFAAGVRPLIHLRSNIRRALEQASSRSHLQKRAIAMSVEESQDQVRSSERHGCIARP